MRQLYMKQKMLSMNEKFSVTDKHNQTVYRVQGSLFKLAKSFTMVDKNNKECYPNYSSPFNITIVVENKTFKRSGGN